MNFYMSNFSNTHTSSPALQQNLRKKMASVLEELISTYINEKNDENLVFKADEMILPLSKEAAGKLKK